MTLATRKRNEYVRGRSSTLNTRSTPNSRSLYCGEVASCGSNARWSWCGFPAGSTSESIWEKTVVAWSILALVFLLLSVQFVSPTRRWRLRRGPSPVPRPEAD